MCKRVYPSQGPVAAAQVSDSGSSCWTEKEAGVGRLRLLRKSPGRWTTETLITGHINRAVVLFLGVFYHLVVETNIKIQVHLNLTILPISCTWCLQTNCGLFGSLLPAAFKNKINSTSVRSGYWFPSISGPFSPAAPCSGILSAPRPFSQIKHVLVLGSEVTWLSDNVAIVAGCSTRIKEVINQLTGLRGQYCSLRGKQCGHSERWALTGWGDRNAASTADSMKQK